MPIAKSERLTVLSEAEQEALYGLPDFDDAQRLEYLAMTETELALLTSSPPLACGHRLRGKGGDSYGAQARHGAAPESLRWVPAAGGIAAPLT